MKVYKVYVEDVRGAKNLTFDQVKKKLFRNVMLGLEVPNRRGTSNKYYTYGNLGIMLDDSGKIVYVENMIRKQAVWFKDNEQYKRLNKLLEIDF